MFVLNQQPQLQVYLLHTIHTYLISISSGLQLHRLRNRSSLQFSMGIRLWNQACMSRWPERLFMAALLSLLWFLGSWASSQYKPAWRFAKPLPLYRPAYLQWLRERLTWGYGPSSCRLGIFFNTCCPLRLLSMGCSHRSPQSPDQSHFL